MKRRISFNVDPTETSFSDHGYTTFASAMSRMKECMHSMGLEIPDTCYNVTYTLAPKHGALSIHGGPNAPFIQPFTPPQDPKLYWDSAIVCQLPREWNGQRINRKVRLLAGEEAADAGLSTAEVQGVRTPA